MSSYRSRLTWVAVSLTAGMGCGSSSGGNGQPSLTSSTNHKFGNVLVNNEENVPSSPTVINAGYESETCSPATTPQGNCYVPPSCASLPHVSAGVITVTGKMPVTLTPGSDNVYSSLVLPQTLADDGQTVQFSAAGADVPAHSGTVTMPTALQITMPSGNVVIDPTHDLEVQWTPSASSMIETFLGVYSATDQHSLGSIACNFVDSDGSGAIPAALLQQLPTTSDGSFGFISFSRFNFSNTTVNDWTISFGGASYVSQTMTVP